MKKIILALFAVLSINAFPAVEFHCWEDGVNQNCTSRKPVNLSGFDSNITDAFNSNWYYTYTSSDSPAKYAFVFYNDEIWENNRQKFSTFSAIDNGATNNSVSMSEGAAFYRNIDFIVATKSVTRFEGSAKLDLTIYAFVGNTKLNLVNASSGFTVSKKGTNLSSIRFGSNTQTCDFTQIGEKFEDGSFQFSLKFSTCPVIVFAVDPNTNTSYQYTSDFSSLTKIFVSDTPKPSNNDGEVERALFNANGNQIGYLIFDFFKNKFRVVNLKREAFSSNS